MKKKTPKKGFENYELVKTPENVVTFGTTLFMRNDGLALKIVFPAGHMVTFEPMKQSEATIRQKHLGRDVPVHSTWQRADEAMALMEPYTELNPKGVVYSNQEISMFIPVDLLHQIIKDYE
jgi:hypothetical protein